MSGGIAYVFDEQHQFENRCNLDMVDLEALWRREDRARLKELVTKHLDATGSRQAKRILDNWQEMAGWFVKVMPIDYRKALENLREREEVRSEETPATEEVFYG